MSSPPLLTLQSATSTSFYRYLGCRLAPRAGALHRAINISEGKQLNWLLLPSTNTITLQTKRFPQPATVNYSRSFTTSNAFRMASDDDYMAFLNKANKDPSEGHAKAQSTSTSKQEFKATDEGAQIPAVIQEATKDTFYISDADEPFVPVYLAWDESGKGLPDEEEFASLIHHPDPSNAEIEIQDPADWDPQGQYKTILDAVRKAGKGNDVRVYRVSKGGVRVEYWVVTTEGSGSGAKLVGAKALAVES
ncbi:uncharacterized protein F4812DRAFT_413635 [Daldinia caldariorum]|uniref:uncharacterized protein n=1 Tax=Daldinia caldariorum TaxID=326644 RepID=UPI002007F288|nr:uncharacterized protein F4812DRAFT_413635 [Daldinia caldariorum]KAI1471343.1 hypothetical protein F4812DRAFT_413635 [Daldinia caldariorum]